MSRMAVKRIGNTKDDRIFSMATPALMSSAYHRVYDPVNGVSPSSKRILEDIYGVFVAMKIVVEKKGVYVQWLAEGTGRRFIKSKKKMGHGGKRKAMGPSSGCLADVTKMHPTLREMMAEARVKRAKVADTEEEIPDEAVADKGVADTGVLLANKEVANKEISWEEIADELGGDVV